jgi:predicted GIY-YIG superfamily endonuclease
MLRCADGTLYTGIAKDVERRVQDHNDGKGAKYTRGRGPVALVYRERCRNQSRAVKRELAIKGMTRAQKLHLSIASVGRMATF